MLAHELRTPITVLAGFTELLLAEQPGPLGLEQRRCLDEMRKSCERLTRFVDELAAAGHRLGPAAWVHPECASFARLAESVAAATKPLLDRRRQTLQLCVAPGVGQGWFDPVRIEQVLQNLMATASKYGLQDGRIDLVAEAVAGPQGGAVRVAVIDDGPGIALPDRERVFEPWLRLAPEAAPPGLGLGLAICRAIVTAHGGEIVVEACPGRGACFVFTLPIAQGAAS